jgi:trans-2,3-dihydro-3-hydroxyanthranilate isomerase
MRRFSFVTLDVFASRPLEGNPVAVFTDARGMTDDEMQAVAREMRLSETTFVIPRDAAVERERGIKVRIFTVAEELDFAGHPTLGTASLLAETRGLDEVALDLRVGKIPVRFERRPDGRFGEMTQRDPEFGSIHDAKKIAAALGVALDDIDTSLPIQTVSTGFAFAIVALKSLEAIGRLSPDIGKLSEYVETTDARQIYVVARETVDSTARLHARMLFYGGEDPATGSAAGCTAAWMVAHGFAKPDEQVLIEQGLEMKRPSRIFVRAGRDGAAVRNVRVGGYTAEAVRGELTLR